MNPWHDVYFDELGLIVQHDGDGGDTAQREGWAWFGLWTVETILGLPAPFEMPIGFHDSLDYLEVERSGEFRRHPTQDGFRSDPDAFSRDQLIPLIAAMGVRNDAARLRRSRQALRPCHIIATCVQGTTDLAGPDLLNHYRRALREAPDANEDLMLLGGVLARLDQANRNPEDVGDDLNLLIYLTFAWVTTRTSNSDAALAAYMPLRPVSAGCFLTHYRKAFPEQFDADEDTMRSRIQAGRSSGWAPDCHPVLGALRWYFRVESGGSPGLAELWAPVIDHLAETAETIVRERAGVSFW